MMDARNMAILQIEAQRRNSLDNTILVGWLWALLVRHIRCLVTEAVARCPRLVLWNEVRLHWT